MVRLGRFSPAPPGVVRIGAVGAGYWGPNVIRNLAELSDFDLCCICDVDPARLRPLATRYPAARATTRVDDIVDDPNIDAIYLATPVSTHYALVKLALLSGKHVLVEKPLATTVEQAEELGDLAAQRGLTLMVGHTFVFSPPVRKIKELIDAAQIGPIYYIETTRVNLGLFQKDVSVLWDLGPHDLSILMYWLNEVPTTVAARGRSFHGEPLEDVAFLSRAASWPRSRSAGWRRRSCAAQRSWAASGWSSTTTTRRSRRSRCTTVASTASPPPSANFS